ncbi:MAG: CoB--CoM heterodisulfide reductase iron-sulfur subunit A [Candidatus Syntrophoarchaeum sp. GoM_oil]|nr:MAG: CoB--CoM heterodisulfide reductase iron-sulfur subunit A [Candidatus Syntrophoarchaeum sp. GoM_oil]
MAVCVIGGGISGVMAALSLAGRGTETIIIESEDALGGHMVEIADCVSGFEPKLIEAEANPLIEVITGATVEKIDGAAGNFTLTLSDGRTINASSIILATGYTPFDPSIWSRYHLENPNVYTSLEFERIISLSSPTGGKLPDNINKIGFIQCIGSREPNVNPLCSSVCCMYTANEVKTLKARNPDTEVYVFYMDLRVAGKDVKVIEKLKKEGVSYIRTRVPEILTDNGNVRVQYEDTVKAELKTLDLDAVVLAVGLLPSKSTKLLAELTGVELDEDGYFKVTDAIRTSIDGIYTAGCSSTPLRISDSVAQAEAAATLASEEGSTMIESPEMIEVTGEPSVGVVIFTDNNDLGKYLDLEKIKSEISSIDGITGVEKAATFQDLATSIESSIKAGSNRILVAGLSHRKHEEMVRDMAERAGLNRYLVELANIREQAAWVHPFDEASAKSIDLIKMGIAKLGKLSPLKVESLPVTKKALVLGGGVAGMRASIEIASKGIGVYLIEREDKLGGILGDSNEIVADLMKQVEADELIRVMTSGEVERIDGFVGNFSCMVADEKLEAGAIVIATGAERVDPTGLYNYGSDSKVITNAELTRMLKSGLDAKTVAMIQCDSSMSGSIETVANALEIKKQNRTTEVFVLCEDVKTYGVYEKLYRDARGSGVIFLRYEPDKPPTFENGIVSIFDTMIGDEVQIKPDVVVLGVGMDPKPVSDRFKTIFNFRFKLDDEGYIFTLSNQPEISVYPLDTTIDGVYVCGSAKRPVLIDTAITEAIGAAGRALKVLGSTRIITKGEVATVSQTACIACETCVDLCPYKAVKMVYDRAEIIPGLCRGCGICASECPAKAIQVGSFSDNEIIAQIEEILGVV